MVLKIHVLAWDIHKNVAGFPCPGLGHTQKCGCVNWVMELPPSPLDSWISNGNTDTNKRKKDSTKCDLIDAFLRLVSLKCYCDMVYLISITTFFYFFYFF